MKFFNTEGPIKPDLHYYIPPLTRWNLAELLTLIARQKYFVLHAPRQTGKTTCLLALLDYLNREGTYTALYVNVEAAQAARENISEGMKTILIRLAAKAREYLQDPFLTDHWPRVFQATSPTSALIELLTAWCMQNAKPIVLLIDEIDALIGDTLISVLRQLRDGYASRPQFFPQSVILCGVRDVRDYRLHTDAGKALITGGSAFNIKAKSLRLGNFTSDEIRQLYLQHTAATNQPFEETVFDLAWQYTQGQPWLVNALGYEVCFEMETGQDRTQKITCEMLEQAKETLILRRDTHLDQLFDKLQEPRVRRVLEPILAGAETSQELQSDDVQYVIDLGLICQAKNSEIDIANAIYREVIPRELAWQIQAGLSHKSAWYIDPDGKIDMFKLLQAFQEFFREHADDPHRLAAIVATFAAWGELIIFPAHPRTLAALEKNSRILPKNVVLLEPVGYLDMLLLEKSAAKILTDSGASRKRHIFWNPVHHVTRRDRMD